MHEIKTPGLLLQAIPYLGKQHILKVFTLEDGLVTLMAKSGHSPFYIAEWVYRKKRSDIYTLQDSSLLDGLLDLRQNYETLCAAGRIAQDLLHSQLPCKKNTDLYALVCSYFKKLSTFSRPEVLVASFRMKLLLHDGLLSIQETCTTCKENACHLFQGESYCLTHGPTPGLSFDADEWKQLLILSFARQFSLLQSLESLPMEKIERLFKERLVH